MRFDASMFPSVEDLATGNRVGPYTLLFRLGKGGMGEVWCASAGSSTGGMGDFLKLVALKLLRDAEEGSNSSVMFFDEARTAAALHHAAIVPTLDLGQAAETYYLAMEMVRGPSLTALLQQLALKKRVTPPALVAYIGERIASALDYANGRAEIQGQKLRLVHRDISPHNVLLDQSGNVVLSDFGVARTAVQDHLSRVGTIRGKPSYMAPEQVNGGEIDGRTDIFALGTVLYEASCVKRLFGRGKPLDSMRAILDHQPEPLSEKVPGFPPELSAVIHKALAKRPEDRFQSAGEMLAALSECSRKLTGASTVQRDLAELIGELFPDGSFDVEGKARDALSSIGEVTHTDAQQEGDVLVPTTISPRYAAPSVWPIASHADPLAPEALEEAEREQTRIGHLRAGGAIAPAVHSPPMVMPPPVPPLRSMLLAGLTLAAVLGLGGVAWVASRMATAPVEAATVQGPAPMEEARRPLVVHAGSPPPDDISEGTDEEEGGARPPSVTPASVGGDKVGPRGDGKGKSPVPKPTSPPTGPKGTSKPEPQATRPEPFAASQQGALACVRALREKRRDGQPLLNKIAYIKLDSPPEVWRPVVKDCVAQLNAD